MARIDELSEGQRLAMAAASGYSVRQLSTKFHLCPRQLRRDFWRLYGRGPKAWLSGQRLSRAVGLMLHDHWSVKATALKLGYKQVSHFSGAFKLHYGLSPSAFLHQLNSTTSTTTIPFSADPPNPQPNLANITTGSGPRLQKVRF